MNKKMLKKCIRHIVVVKDLLEPQRIKLINA